MTPMGDVKNETLFSELHKAYLRGIAWARLNHESDEAEEYKAAYDYTDKATAALRQADARMEGGGNCPDCGRAKARNATDAANGLCPKWWAIRDEAADRDCRNHDPSSPTVGELEVVAWHWEGRARDYAFPVWAWQKERPPTAPENATALADFTAAQSSIQRAERERDEADNALVDKYRDPKTGSFNFPRDVTEIVRRLDAAEAQLEEARKVLERISSPTQTEGLLWWQIEARAFLSSLKDNSK